MLSDVLYFLNVAIDVTWQVIWTRKNSSLESRPALGPSPCPSAKANYGREKNKETGRQKN